MHFTFGFVKETEKNYMNGLRDSLPKELQGKLVIKVVKTETKNLVNEALNMASINPQYGEPWIVFDRDQVENFDDITSDAEEKLILGSKLMKVFNEHKKKAFMLDGLTHVLRRGFTPTWVQCLHIEILLIVVIYFLKHI